MFARQWLYTNRIGGQEGLRVGGSGAKAETKNV